MLLKAENIVKRFGNRSVIKGISIKVDSAEIVGLLGRNGAGKTTTFKIVSGILMPNSGRVYLKDKDITKMPIYQRARNGMGYLAQEPSIFQRLTVEENLLAILETIESNWKTCKSIASSLLNEYGLSKVSRQKAYTLSGGETRRLEICRAMIVNPSLIMLDEPFSGIDPIGVSELQTLVKELKEKGVGVLLTDHNVRDTLSITDRSYIIDEGTILAEGTKESLLNNHLVRQRYLGKSFKM